MLSKRARRRLAARGDLPAVLAAEAADAATVARRQEALDARRSKWYDDHGRPRRSPGARSAVLSIDTPYQRYMYTLHREQPWFSPF